MSLLTIIDQHKIDIYAPSEGHKIEYLARLLAAYDEVTWNKLRYDRKRTYRRAASTLFHSWGDFMEWRQRP